MMFSKVTDFEYFEDHWKEEYGGKGANLIRMSVMGLPVPPAYLLNVHWSNQYNSSPEDKDYVMNRIGMGYDKLIQTMERETGRVFGPQFRSEKPLLVSVRSGAAVSMPGMMDTVLNVGLNDVSVRALASTTNLEFAWDSYRRFIQGFATTVLGYDKSLFQPLVDTAAKFCPAGRMTVRMSQHLVAKFKEIAPDFPQNARDQLLMSIEAVFKSWSSERAVAYRELEDLNDKCWGTGVVVQQMVFGNMNEQSGTGVVFTRNPITGTGEKYGDFLVNAQGEDVVDGSHQTLPINSLLLYWPEIWNELSLYCDKLERELHDMCDIEFTVENGKLWILQVRKGKRSSTAARRIPLELLSEGVLTVDDAMGLIPFGTEDAPNTITTVDGFSLAGHGLVAAEGDVEGVMAFSSKAAVEMAEAGKTVVLVTECTNPEDMPGIIASVGMLTMKGGLVSHAAVVARSWNKPCIVGAGSKTDVSWENIGWNTEYNCHDRLIVVNGQKYAEGDSIILRPSEKGAFYLKRES